MSVGAIAVASDVTIDVGIAPSYSSYTKAVNATCDIYVEVSQGVVVNQTLIGCIWDREAVAWQ